MYHGDCHVRADTMLSQAASAEFLRELILLRDGRLSLSNNIELSADELAAIIDFICTS